MTTESKITAISQEAKGKAKQVAGKATGDRKLRANGKADEAKAHLKLAAEHLKDAAKP
jgi:uncharacterized protein YjbJ (UPF0337 family)